MTDQYEKKLLDAFFEPIQPSKDLRTILTGFLGGDYRETFGRWNQTASEAKRQTLIDQAGSLGELYMSPENTGTNPKGRLDWAKGAFSRLGRNGRRRSSSSCLLCLTR